MWATLGGIGAAWFVRSIAISALSVLFTNVGQQWTGPRPFEIADILGTAVGVSVAWHAGGRPAMFGYLGYLIVSLAISLSHMLVVLQVTAIPSDIYSPLSVIIRHWTRLLGLVLGLALGRLVSSGRPGANALLEGAGAFALAPVIVTIPTGFIVTPANPGSSEALAYTALIASAALAVVGASFVLARRASRPLIAALALAAVTVLAWLPLWSFPAGVRAPRWNERPPPPRAGLTRVAGLPADRLHARVAPHPGHDALATPPRLLRSGSTTLRVAEKGRRSPR